MKVHNIEVIYTTTVSMSIEAESQQEAERIALEDFSIRNELAGNTNESQIKDYNVPIHPDKEIIREDEEPPIFKPSFKLTLGQMAKTKNGLFCIIKALKTESNEYKADTTKGCFLVEELTPATAEEMTAHILYTLMAFRKKSTIRHFKDCFEESHTSPEHLARKFTNNGSDVVAFFQDLDTKNRQRFAEYIANKLTEFNF